MDNNYEKEVSDSGYVYYNFERNIDNDELLRFFERIEQDERVIDFDYIVKTSTDEYEAGMYSFDKVVNIDRQLLENFNTTGINMSFYLKPGEENILVCGINRHNFKLICSNGFDAAEVVESCLTKQMNR